MTIEADGSSRWSAAMGGGVWSLLNDADLRPKRRQPCSDARRAPARRDHPVISHRPSGLPTIRIALPDAALGTLTSGRHGTGPCNPEVTLGRSRSARALLVGRSAAMSLS